MKVQLKMWRYIVLCNTCGFQHAFFWVSVYFVGYSHSPGAWGGLWFSCGVAHCGGSLISVFRGISTGAGGIPVSGGGLAPGNSCMKF